MTGGGRRETGARPRVPGLPEDPRMRGPAARRRADAPDARMRMDAAGGGC